jgi:hypothetical protein
MSRRRRLPVQVVAAQRVDVRVRDRCDRDRGLVGDARARPHRPRHRRRAARTRPPRYHARLQSHPPRRDRRAAAPRRRPLNSDGPPCRRRRLHCGSTFQALSEHHRPTHLRAAVLLAVSGVSWLDLSSAAWRHRSVSRRWTASSPCWGSGAAGASRAAGAGGAARAGVDWGARAIQSGSDRDRDWRAWMNNRSQTPDRQPWRRCGHD